MNKHAFLSKIELHGTAYRRLYDTTKLKRLVEDHCHVQFDCTNPDGTINFDVLCMQAFELGVTKAALAGFLDKAAKPMFADNKLWKFLKLNFNLDLAIPFVTGHWTTRAVKANLIVNTGHKAYADQIGGTTTTAFTAIAYGTGTTAAAAADTALQTEVSRGAATVTNTTTSTTGDTEQWVKTFTAGGTQAITEEGILNNNVSGGILLAHQVFSAVNMVVNDTLQFTHKIQS